MNDLIVATGVSLLAPLGAFSKWLESRTKTIEEWECLPDFGLWLRYYVMRKGKPIKGPIWAIKLPSYKWGEDICLQKECWLRAIWFSGYGIRYQPEDRI